jgi:hypothetical protein
VQSIPQNPTYFDVPLNDLLTFGENLSQKYWRQHARQFDIDDYRSAAGLAIAQAIRDYDPGRAYDGGFRAFVLFRLMAAMRKVHDRGQGIGNMRGRDSGQFRTARFQIIALTDEVAATLRGEFPRQEDAAFLGEVLRFLGTDKASRMLLDLAQEHLAADIAHQWGCGIENVRKHIYKRRHALRAWAKYEAA